jgi:hypothetical protein
VASLVLPNPGLAPRTVLVSVSSTSAAVSGTFDLRATTGAVTPGPYAETRVPAACDDMTAATALPPSSGSRWASFVHSAPAALPFAFQLYGAPVTHYSVSSFGYAQLWPAAGGTPRDVAENAAVVPSAGEPNGFVAPYWDSLRDIDAATTGVRVATFGTAPNRRFTIQWTAWDNIVRVEGIPVRLTFQAQLHETTNAVEFHYCELTAGTPSGNGGAATVGLESLAGDQGMAHSVDVADAVTRAQGLRFAPRP